MEFHSMELYSMKLYSMELRSKLSPSNGTSLLTGILRPKVVNFPLSSCFLINLDFLQPHTVHFDNVIVLPVLVFETLGFILYLFFLHFKQ